MPDLNANANANTSVNTSSVTVTLTCSQLTTQLINGNVVYVATMTYQNYLGNNAFIVNSSSPFKFVVGQTYTATVA